MNINETVEFLVDEGSQTLSEYKIGKALGHFALDTVTLKGVRAFLGAASGDLSHFEEIHLRKVDYIENEQERQQLIKDYSELLKQMKEVYPKLEDDAVRKRNQQVQRIAQKVIAAAKARKF